MRRLFSSKRTSKIFYLINNPLAYRYGTNDITIYILFVSLL